MAKEELLKNVNDRFTVKYPDGTSVIIGRIKRSDAKRAIVLLKELMYYFIREGFSVGSAILDDECYSLLTQIAELLPHYGSDTKGVDLDQLSDVMDLEQIAAVFFTTSRDKDSGEITFDETKGWEPSLICKINSYNYAGMAGNALERFQAERTEANQKLLELAKQVVPE